MDGNESFKSLIAGDAMNRNNYKTELNLAAGILLMGVIFAMGATTSNLILDNTFELNFKAQTGMASPEKRSVLVTNPIPPAIFIGNYSAAGVNGIGFRIRVDVLPSECNLFISNRVNNSEWRFPLLNRLSADPTEWVTITVPFEYGTGWSWWNSGGTAAMFSNDLQVVEAIGIRVLRAGVAVQNYQIKDCMLFGGAKYATGCELYNFMLAKNLRDGSADNDKDGLSNWGEFLTGSDPLDRSSAFLLKIESSQVDGKVSVKWSHMPGRKFAIWRGNTSGGGFERLTPIGAEKASTEPENVEEVNEDDGQNYFYKIEVLE